MHSSVNANPLTSAEICSSRCSQWHETDGQIEKLAMVAVETWNLFCLLLFILFVCDLGLERAFFFLFPLLLSRFIETPSPSTRAAECDL